MPVAALQHKVLRDKLYFKLTVDIYPKVGQKIIIIWSNSVIFDKKT